MRVEGCASDGRLLTFDFSEAVTKVGIGDSKKPRGLSPFA